MADIKKFLDKYDTILFDMDGVVTSEQQYWTCAAMTVYEMLMSTKYYGDMCIDEAYVYKNREQIRQEVFCDDKTIIALKNKGLNSNWDLAYVVLAEAIICDTHDFGYIYERICNYSDDIFWEYDLIAHKLSEKLGESVQYYKRESVFWRELQALFERKYFGTKDEIGLMQSEKPLLGLERTRLVLSALKESGKTLGIGTGRPACEVEGPLKNWGVYELFDKDRIITYDDVIDAEKYMASQGAEITLTKPHPFMFLKGAMKKTYPTEKICSGEFDKQSLKKVLVVGDAGSDILAAQAAGMDFLAVLTGISGDAARGYFESQRANYILGSICDMIEM